MNPQEKAKELVEKYKELQITTLGCGDGNPCIIKNTMIYNSAKQCALIAVDEIINCDNFFKTLDDVKEFTKYWYEVQEEINNL